MRLLIAFLMAASVAFAAVDDGVIAPTTLNVPATTPDADTLGYQSGVGAGEWFGFEVGEGNSSSNMGAFAGWTDGGVSTRALSPGWGYYASDSYLHDRYAYGFMDAPGTNYHVGANGIVFMVWASGETSASNAVSFEVGGAGTVTNAYNVAPSSTGTSRWHSVAITGPNLPAAWTTTTPVYTNFIKGVAGVSMAGLPVEATFKAGWSNTISAKVLIDWRVNQ